MKLAIIFPVMNQRELAKFAVDQSIRNLSGETNTELLLIDNASVPRFDPVFFREAPNGFPSKLVRLEKNIGVYPIFWEALKHTDADVLAFFHTDLFVDEKGWDKRVLEQFEQNPKLGLMGFIGSNEIDEAGGRGLGTTSNFVGKLYIHIDGLGNKKQWQGSPASVHGKVSDGLSKAAVVDGCAMIFRREVLSMAIRPRENFPLHHFYDKLLSCETREAGCEIAVLGISCDHISGQTVSQEPAYELMAQEWAQAHGLKKAHNWDHALYTEAERQWLKEYKEEKKLIPCKV